MSLKLKIETTEPRNFIQRRHRLIRSHELIRQGVTMVTSILAAIFLSGNRVEASLVSISSETEIVGFIGESILGLRGSTLISMNSDDSQRVIAEKVKSIKSLHTGSSIVYFSDGDKMILQNGLLHKFDSTWKTIVHDKSGTFYCIASLDSDQLAVQIYANLNSKPIRTLSLPEDITDARFIQGTSLDKIALAVDSRAQEYPELLLINSNSMNRMPLAQGPNSFSPQFLSPDGTVLGFLFPTPSNDLDPLFEGNDYRFGTYPSTSRNLPALWFNNQKFATKLNLDATPDSVLLKAIFAFNEKYLIEAFEKTSDESEQTPIYFYCNAGSSKIMKLKIPSNSRLIDTNVKTGKLLFANDSNATIVRL